MPTIEIVSINAKGLGLNQDEFDIAILEESNLKSYRGLFYDFLWKQKGIIIHIGNPAFRENKKGGFFAGQIIDWSFVSEENQEELNQQKFKFQGKYRSDIDGLLHRSINGSPVSKIYFLTDYQFGPKKVTFEVIGTILDYWTLHDNKGLRFNTIYEIH